MRFFRLIFTLAALVGSGAVYHFGPLARPYVPDFLRPQSLAADNGAEYAPETLPSETPASAKGVTAGPAALPAQPTPPARPARPAVGVTEEEELAPILNGIYLAQRGDKRSWGITHQETSYYRPDGSRLGTVPGGTLLLYRGTQTSSKGGMLECLPLDAPSSENHMLIKLSDVYIFTGDHRKLSRRQLDDLKEYYSLNAQIALRKKELLQISASKNPHFKAYQEKHNLLMAHIEKAKALAARRDKSAGISHMEIEDQLRRMKITESQLRRDYDKSHAQFRAWKEQHAAELPQPDKDQTVQKLFAQKMELMPRLPGLAF